MSSRRMSFHAERAQVEDLNFLLASFCDKLNTLKDQSKKIKDQTCIAYTQAMENQITDMQKIYENKINDLSYKLEDCIAQRNKAELDAGKFSALYQEFDAKYKDELTQRKKLENALADAHRLLSEKDSCIQDCRITIAQHQNAHLETTKERDALQSQLTEVQIACDSETSRRKDLEEQVKKLQDELNFRNQIHEKEQTELYNKLAAAERCIEIADEQLKGHKDVDDSLANMIAKMRVQTQNDFESFKQEARAAYEAAAQDNKSKLDAEVNRRVQAEDETIQVKAIVEELNAKCANLDAKAGSLEDQNRSLIHTLQIERTDAANKIQTLESRNDDLFRQLHDMKQELTAVQNANIPLEMELQGFACLMEREEKKLNLALSNPDSELVQNARGELISSRTPYTGRRSKPNSPKPQNPVGSARSRSRNGADAENPDLVKLPPLKVSSRTSSPRYEYPGSASNTKTYKPYSAAGGSAPVIY